MNELEKRLRAALGLPAEGMLRGFDAQRMGEATAAAIIGGQVRTEQLQPWIAHAPSCPTGNGPPGRPRNKARCGCGLAITLGGWK